MLVYVSLMIVNVSLEELPKQGFFKAFCHNTMFLLHVEFLKGERTFLTPKA